MARKFISKAMNQNSGQPEAVENATKNSIFWHFQRFLAVDKLVQVE